MRSQSWFVGVLLLIAAELHFATTAAAQAVLFRDEMNSSAAWGMNVSSADTLVTFGYDYSADGIPETPHHESGDTATRGVKLEANISSPGSMEYITLNPFGYNFTGSYRLRFDAWMNYDLQEALGAASGTTEFLGGGVGHDGFTADIASGAQAMTTGDGGAAADWRAFKSPPQFTIAAAKMAGGSQGNQVAYYSDFLPGVVPPAVQGQPDSAGIAGAPGFQWVTWEFTAINADGINKVSVFVEKPTGERLRIVDIDCNDTSDGSNGCSSDGNVSLFYGDFFTSVTTRPDLTFGVIDNVVVNRVLPGDYNGDGIVDAADYTVWRDGLGSSYTLDDYEMWKTHFGETAGSGAGANAVAAPEPAAVALLMLAVAGVGFARVSALHRQ